MTFQTIEQETSSVCENMINNLGVHATQIEELRERGEKGDSQALKELLEMDERLTEEKFDSEIDF